MSQANVDRAKALLAKGDAYVQGCSGFVCAVLQIPWQDANSLMGDDSLPLGSNGNYNNVSPGDIVGWLAADSVTPATHGHVSVYIGEPAMKFIDVKDDGLAPRPVKNGYGVQGVFKSTNF